MRPGRVASPSALTVILLSVAVLAVALPIAAWGASANDDADAQAAARLVQRTREAPSRYSFTGDVSIVWAVGGSTRRADVEVHDAAGSMEVLSGGRAVFDDGRHTYFRDGADWTSLLIEPRADELPAPGKYWRLSTRPGRLVAGRPTTLVVASRRDGSAAQELFVDDDTGLLLGRRVFGPRSAVQRSVTFTALEIGTAGATMEQPTDAHADPAEMLTSVPDGYRAPSSPAAGYELVTRSRHPGGVLLFYSDGMFSASVFEQRGDLKWATLPAGGTTTDIGGNRARRYREASGEVLVWQHGGLVYTSVSDAPSDVSEQLVAGLSGPGPSVPEAIVDYVLGPFGWR